MKDRFSHAVHYPQVRIMASDGIMKFNLYLVRDWIGSHFEKDYASVFISSSDTTELTTQDTWYILDDGIFGVNIKTDSTSHATGRITYTGTEDKIFEVDVSASFTTDKNPTVIEVAVGKNGTVDANSTVAVTLNSITNQFTIPLAWQYSLSTNDYVEIFVRDVSTGGSAVLECKKLNFRISE